MKICSFFSIHVRALLRGIRANHEISRGSLGRLKLGSFLGLFELSFRTTWKRRQVFAMASTSSGLSSSAQVLLNKGKKGAAAYVYAECSNRAIIESGYPPRNLSGILDILLNPSKAIDDWDAIDWCKWLMAGGRTPDEFVNTGL